MIYLFALKYVYTTSITDAKNIFRRRGASTLFHARGEPLRARAVAGRMYGRI